MTSAKELIVSLLGNSTYGVKVYDDSNPATLLTGTIQDRWPGPSAFASKAYVITVGPVIGVEAELDSLGSFGKRYTEHVQVDVWVIEKRGQTYAAEKTRQDLVQEVDRCLLHYAPAPSSGFTSVNASGWQEIDEPGMKRSSMIVEVTYEKART